MGLAADFVLIVVAGLAGGMLARALGLPLLVGYVVAGVAVGPHTAGPTVAQIHDIEMLAEIGVALLLFSIGLEVSFRDLHAVRRVALIGGPIQIIVTMAAAASVARAFGAGLTESVWLGAMISVSSTMVVLKALASGRHSSTLASRVMVGLLLVQDLAVVPMLIILPQLGRAENLASRVGTALALAAGLLIVVYFSGVKLLPPLFRRILVWGSRELFLVAVVAAGVGIGAAMHAAGFSFALGAFVAGLILSESEFSHQALSDVVPLRDIFGLLFFVTVGMLFDPSYALRNAGPIIAAVAAIIAGKALILGLVARVFGYRYMAPWLIAAGLSQIGEFSFVLARTGLTGGFISESMYNLVLTATVLTMALSPFVFPLAMPLGRAWRRRFEKGSAPAAAVFEPDPCCDVVIGGYGRTGRAVASALRSAGIPFLVVESSYSLLEDLRGDGLTGLYGDISREEILRAAGIDRVKMLVLTMPDPDTVRLAVEGSRRSNPSIAILARGTKAHHLRELRAKGVWAVQPEFEGGVEMVKEGLRLLGSEPEEVARIAGELRREFYEGE